MRQYKSHLHHLVPEIADDVDVGALGKERAVEALNGKRCGKETGQITIL
jgi:hypothetical protein